MPWSAKDAPKTVKGAKKRRQWSHIANACLSHGNREGQCKRIASGAMKKQRSKKK